MDTLGFFLCTHCGDRIGVYEPAWLELTDGSVRASSFLNLERDMGQSENGWRLWHVGCLAPDAMPDAVQALRTRSLAPPP
jgi:hypothetical protein